MISAIHHRYHRRSIRLAGYDYSQSGMYFVTICTAGRQHLFGDVWNGQVRLNASGRIARENWLAIPDHFPTALVDEFVIMPDHLHGIIIISDSGARDVGARDVGARHAVPLLQNDGEQFGKPFPGSIPTIVRSYKSAVANRINQMQGTPGLSVWQRNYWEHIIRSTDELNRIRDYIKLNPRQWRSEPDDFG